MRNDSLRVSTVLHARPKEVYAAWMSGKKHGEMTGGAAKISERVGGRFAAWDGYIEGKTLELAPGKRIVQSWRTSEFSSDDPDSRLEVTFAEAKGGTRITLKHTNIPPGQGAGYKKGWIEFYFTPMKKYFAGKQDR